MSGEGHKLYISVLVANFLITHPWLFVFLKFLFLKLQSDICDNRIGLTGKVSAICGVFRTLFIQFIGTYAKSIFLSLNAFCCALGI